MKTLQKICLKIIAGVGVIIFTFLTFYSWRYTARMYTENEDLTILKDSWWKTLLFLAGILFCVFLVKKITAHCSPRLLHGIAIAASLLTAAGLLYLVRSAHAYALGVDQLHIYLAAEGMTTGTFFEYQPGEYFNANPYQYGLAFLYSLLFRITGSTSPEILHSAQAICTGITIYAGFHITGEVFHNAAAEILYLIGIISFLPLHLYSLFIYGESISICGIFLSILFFLKANHEISLRPRIAVIFWLLSGLFLALACTARISAIIVWIAMAIVQLFLFIKKKQALELVMLFLILFMTLSSQKLITYSIEQYTGAKLDHNIPTILRLAMGFQGDSSDGAVPGAYNGYIWRVYNESGFDPQTASETGVQYIRERFAYWAGSPSAMITFFKEKLLNQWNEPSYGAFTMTRFMEEPKPWVTELYYGSSHNTFYQFLNLYQAAGYLLLLGYFLLLFMGKQDTALYLPGLIIIGGFLFSAIWEAKSRYILPYITVAIPCMAGALVCYYNKFSSIIRYKINKISISRH